MQRLDVVVIFVYFTILCSVSAWTYPLQTTGCNHQPGRCTLVSGIDVGSEDIQVLPNGLAFITSGLDPTTPGKIFLFDFKKPRSGVVALDIVGDFDRDTFSPHGLNIWVDTNRILIYIFVINHGGKNKETVEKFRFDATSQNLYHVKTYQDHRTIIHLNDLVVMGEDSFYFTNFYQFDIKLEILLRLRLGYVGFYDGFRGHVIIRRLFIPNGLNTSPDGKYVYLTEFSGKTFSVYARMSDNSLCLKQRVPLCSLVDNIDVDIATGDVWVTGHADLQLNQKYMIPPHTSISPSQVNNYCLCSSPTVQWLERRTLN
ncbi:hypothetical protein NP493_376g03018 [Ridgeia piscesae]|uniref:Paraoxonase n=1 Tax=Ridgeia piscesae TaxID=27915 RepID=A0AAD9NVX0_RIDPI|nr:hypothetical protein NP493_376g03018 [Ridgeia piscesae]